MARESARQDCIIERGQSRRELRRFFYLVIIYVPIYILNTAFIKTLTHVPLTKPRLGLTKRSLET